MSRVLLSYIWLCEKSTLNTLHIRSKIPNILSHRGKHGKDFFHEHIGSDYLKILKIHISCYRMPLLLTLPAPWSVSEKLLDTSVATTTKRIETNASSRKQQSAKAKMSRDFIKALVQVTKNWSSTFPFFSCYVIHQMTYTLHKKNDDKWRKSSKM